MEFIFPELRGLGPSSMAQRYGLASLEEARANLAHPLLGPRLVECTQAVLAVEGRSAHAIFGAPDDLKLCSCMTLFALAAEPGERVFRQALDRHCEGRPDRRTLALCGADGG